MNNIIQLYFHGYTWDEYFSVIGNKSGIMVAYRGSLDRDGFVKMKDILYVDGANKISDLYESDDFSKIRKKVDLKERLFFSYAEIDADIRKEVVSQINKRLGLIDNNDSFSDIHITCKGACALFPNELIAE